jgi:hypothetical protein
LLCGLLQDEESLLRVCHLESSLLVILTFSSDISARYPHVALEAPFYFAE